MWVTSFPKYLDQVELTTWCGALGSHWAERRTQIKCNGVVAIECAALWVRVDFKTMKPVALSAELIELLQTATGGRKISSRLEIGKNLPDLNSNDATSQNWPIRFSDMDAVGHLNNAAYWEVLEEYLGANSGQRAPLLATVEHHGAIDPGNQVRIVTQKLNGRVVLRHVLADNTVAAVTELILG
jgi:acyl-ACP thioesterase